MIVGATFIFICGIFVGCCLMAIVVGGNRDE